MEKQNEVILTGIFKTEAVTPTFTKQFLEINSKDRDGQWKAAQMDIYIKDDVRAAKGLQEGMEAKIKGWIAFNFATGGRSFPKVVVTEIVECAQPTFQGQQAQAGQPAMAGVPPMPGAAPQAPGMQAQPVSNFPQQPAAPVAPSMGVPAAPGVPQMPTQAPTVPGM